MTTEEQLDMKRKLSEARFNLQQLEDRILNLDTKSDNLHFFIEDIQGKIRDERFQRSLPYKDDQNG